MERFLSVCSLWLVALGPTGAIGHLLEKPTCAKGDSVVWLDTKLHVYFPETSPYYGKTYHGEWDCMSDAVKSGARLTKYVTSTTPTSATPAVVPSGASASPESTPTTTRPEFGILSHRIDV